MKFLLAAVTSSALVATFATAEMCTIPQLTTIMTTTFTIPCKTGSGLDFATLTGAPTDAQLTSFCKTPACTSFLKTVMAQNPPDCTLPMGNLKFRSQLLDPIERFCNAASSGAGTVTSSDAGGASSGNATASHSNSTSTTNTTMPANTMMPATNTTTTTKPDTTVTNPNESASKANSDTESTTATTAPTPTPTKSAAESSFAVSACASVLGVAALLWVF